MCVCVCVCVCVFLDCVATIVIVIHVWFITDTVNCVDRHASKYPDRVALIWEKDEPGQEERVTYK